MCRRTGAKGCADMKKRKQKYDMLTIITCVVFGIIWTILGYILYQLLHDVIWTPIVVGLYFAGLAVMQILAILVSGLFRGYRVKKKNIKKAWVLVPLVLVAALVLDMIYEVRFKAASKEPTSYIFVIDDSGSNSTTDPENKRGDAYLKVLEDCDPNFPFAVYTFTNDAHLLIPMRKASQAESISDSLGTNGNTSIMRTLNTVLDNLKNNVHTDAGENPRIILISDGADYRLGIRSVHRKCLKQNVSISTIGFGNADGGLLSEIAEGANGVSITIDNVDALANATQSAATAVSAEQHNLLNFRDNVRLNLLYGIARLLFVLILGFLFLLIKAELTQTNVGSSNTLAIQMILMVISGVSLEVGINTLRIPMFFAHLIMCILFLITFSVRGKVGGNDPWGSSGNGKDTFDMHSLTSDPFLD